MILHKARRRVLAATTLAFRKHRVVLRAWDTSGNYGDKTIRVTIA